MKTIKFPPEYEEKLKKLKVKTKFVNNLLNYGFYNPNRLEEYARDNHYDWYMFIAGGFIWEDTPEEHDFWAKIADS